VKLTEIFRESLILPDLQARDKAGCLKFMAETMAAGVEGLDVEKLEAAILERERLSSTGIGGGIAIPHVRIRGFDEHVAMLGRSRLGVSFDAIDRRPVHLIFLIVGPEKENEAHLRILARLAKFLHDASFRDRLLMARDATAAFRAIAEKDAQY